MDTSLILQVLSRWAHVGTAIVLVGGTAFFRFIVVPLLADTSADLVGRIRDRWKKVVHAGILLFLVSGIYNYVTMIPRHKGDGLYHALLGIKMLLALYVFFLASVLVGRSAGTQKFRDQSRKWTSVMLLVAAIIVGISGFVKVRPYVAPAVGSPAISQTQQFAAPKSNDSQTTPEPVPGESVPAEPVPVEAVK